MTDEELKAKQKSRRLQKVQEFNRHRRKQNQRFIKSLLKKDESILHSTPRKGEKMKEQIAFIIDTLETAIEWADYADDYFKKKHGLEQDRENVKKSIEMLNSLEEQIKGLQSLLDFKQQEISVLESKVGELKDGMDNSDEAIRRRYAKWAYPNESKQN